MLGLILIVFSAIVAAILISRRQPPQMMLLFTHPDGTPCTRPCLFGATPGENDGQTLIRQHPQAHDLTDSVSSDEFHVHVRFIKPISFAELVSALGSPRTVYTRPLGGGCTACLFATIYSQQDQFAYTAEVTLYCEAGAHCIDFGSQVFALTMTRVNNPTWGALEDAPWIGFTTMQRYQTAATNYKPN